ncbi:MAG: TatD family hydrolase [Pseudoxanthomonas sp.]
MVLVDSHCHLDAPEFDTDRNAVMQRARAAGVVRQIVPAIDSAGWAKLKDISASNDGIFPAYGLHPMFLSRHLPQHLTQLGDWLARETPVAVGECGLDYFIEGLDQEQQHLYFTGQRALAREFDLPVIVHARRAVDAVIAAVKRVGGLRGVIHSFSGSTEQARQLWNLGFLLGIGGPVTYERANRLRGLVAEMPMEFLLLETDAPDQPDAEHRGERNEPGLLTVVCETVATLRGVHADEIAAATTSNAQRLFSLPAL